MSGVHGLDNFLRRMAQAKGKMLKAALLAMDQAGEHVIGDAQQLCPVDTGALQASGTTEPAKMTGKSIRKKIGFNTSYAAAVHENLTANHHGDFVDWSSLGKSGKKSKKEKKLEKKMRRYNPNGGAKFLEKAMRRDRDKVMQYVADQCKKELG